VRGCGPACSHLKEEERDDADRNDDAEKRHDQLPADNKNFKDELTIEHDKEAIFQRGTLAYQVSAQEAEKVAQQYGKAAKRSTWKTVRQCLIAGAVIRGANRSRTAFLMSKLGVYIASHNQPVFLRHSLLQVLNQTRLPDVLAVHENVHPKSYRWVVEDVIDALGVAGVKVIYQHTPDAMPMPTFFRPPLQALLDEGCDYFNKVDPDDIIYAKHFETQLGLIDGSGHDYAMNANSQLVVLLNAGGYKYSPKVDFGTWNPTGAHPDAIIFNRKVAESFVAAMDVYREPDDVVLAKYVFPSFKGSKRYEDPTMCYAAHGKTISTLCWSNTPPPEVS
jgi:hypothetical protein